MIDVLDIFAERLKELIDDKGMNLKEFAEDIKIPYSTINSWTLRKRCPSIIYLRMITDYFHISADYLIGREN